MTQILTCGHPDRKHYAHGMCKACYKTRRSALPKAKAYRSAYYARTEVKERVKALVTVRKGRPGMKEHDKAVAATRNTRPEVRAKSFARRTGCDYKEALRWHLIPINERVCYLCDQQNTTDLDHNPITFVIRGWTHHQCNLAEGNVRNSPDPYTLLLKLLSLYPDQDMGYMSPLAQMLADDGYDADTGPHEWEGD